MVIQTMNNTMDTWESRDGMSYPRFRLIDWFFGFLNYGFNFKFKIFKVI